MAEQEIWKPIPGYPDYEVSDWGRVRSYKGLGRPRILKPFINKEGYTIFSLSSPGQPKSIGLHRLLMMAFVGPCPEGQEVCHNDGNPANNRLDNLRYDTHAENKRDAVLHRALIRAKIRSGEIDYQPKTHGSTQ